MKLVRRLPWMRWRPRRFAVTSEVVHVFGKCEHDSVWFGNPNLSIESGPWWQHGGGSRAGNERFIDWPGVGDEYRMTIYLERVPEGDRQIGRSEVMQMIEDAEDHDHGF